MIDWLSHLHSTITHDQPLTLPEQPLPGHGRALALAPHPDDPEAVAVLLRMLARGGWEVYWVILTSGWSGVEDAFAGPTHDEKARVREVEQREAALRFGLPADHLTFLRLVEDAAGDMDAGEENHARLLAFLRQTAPEVVLLPHGNDTNATHRLTADWFSEWATAWPQPVTAVYNEDPKTRAFRLDLQVTFHEDTARWKAAQLECHRSQSARNQATRGITFAERILAINRAGREDGSYAERFEVTVYG